MKRKIIIITVVSFLIVGFLLFLLIVSPWEIVDAKLSPKGDTFQGKDVCGLIKDDPSDIINIAKTVSEDHKKKFLSSVELCGAEEYKINFTNAIISLYNGKWKDSLVAFIDLSDQKDSEVWGNIGLLEYSLFTENISNAEPIITRLRELENISKVKLPNWIIPHYYSWYLWHHCDFQKLNEVLHGYKDKLDPVDYFELKFLLLVREDKLEEAQDLINALPDDVRDHSRVLISYGDLVLLKHGPKEWAAWAKEQVKMHPESLELKQSLADSLLGIGAVQAGFEIYEKIINRKPFDLYIYLSYLDALIHFGGSDNKIGDVLNALQKPVEFPYFDTLVAEIYLINKKYDKMDGYLRTAFKLNECYVRALWVKFNYEKSIGDTKAALTTILDIYKIFPNELEVLLSLLELSYLNNNWDLFWKTEAQISNSKRYISEDLLAQKHSLISQARQEGGKKDTIK